MRPGIEGVSERIRVVSVVGRFLEHSRVFWCANDGAPELYLSSADLMGRNLDRRVELMFPIEDAFLADALRHEVLDAGLRDTVRARELKADGSYERIAPKNGMEAVDSQLITLAARAARQARPVEPAEVPRPALPREAPGG